MPDIRGRLVRLRPMQREDLAHLHRWLNDPDVMQYWDGRDHPATFDRVEARFRKSVEGTDREAERYMIEVLADQEAQPQDPEPSGGPRTRAHDVKVIGMVQHGRVHPRARHAQVDLLIGDPAFRDAGFGTDAMHTMVRHLVESLRVHRVWLTLRASNVRAMRGAEKVGFVREGVLREHDMLEGQLVDVVVYGILSQEWSPDRT